MEANENKHVASNGGYSLVELIVAVLISGVVMLAVTGFLTSGLNHYRNVNSETLLQMESQMTELFMTELIQEATYFEALDSGDLSGGATYALEVTRGSEIYMVALVGSELRYSEVTGGSPADRLAYLLAKDRNETFLAQHVASFSLLDDADTFLEASQNVYAGTVVEIQYQVDRKSYVSSSLIMLRNVERN